MSFTSIHMIKRIHLFTTKVLLGPVSIFIHHFFFKLSCVARRILVLQLGSEPGPGSKSSESYPLDCREIPHHLIHISCYLLNISSWIFKRPHIQNAVAAATKSFQSCPTLCDPIDSSPPGSAVPGILQARTLEWVAISFSNA